jgi:uncharacterized protein YbjT (DUF2867 family)
MNRTLCILGGTGFVGRHLVAQLAQNPDYSIRVLTRNRERHRDLLVHPRVQIIEVSGLDESNLKRQFTGVDVVINLIGILNERKKGDFRRVHAELPRRVVQVCRAVGVPRLLHMSALNAGNSKAASVYLQTKGEGENLVHVEAGQKVAVTSFRPSVIFGLDDSFLNRFAGLLKLPAPFFPLACPDTRFAPIHVQDVAAAFVQAVEDRSMCGQRYDLCGPAEYSLIELVKLVRDWLGLKRPVLGLPDGLSQLQARILERLPGKPFTMDNYLSLQLDSVCSDSDRAFPGERISLEATAPQYLAGQNSKSLYDPLRARARR